MSILPLGLAPARSEDTKTPGILRDTIRVVQDARPAADLDGGVLAAAIPEPAKAGIEAVAKSLLSGLGDRPYEANKQTKRQGHLYSWGRGETGIEEPPAPSLLLNA